MPNIGELIQSSKKTVQNYLDIAKESKDNLRRRRQIAPMARRADGGTVGPIVLIAGWVLLAVVLALCCVYLFLYEVTPGMVFGIAAVPLVLSLVMIIWGYRKNKQANVYDTYKTFFEKKPYVKVLTLAKETHASVSTTDRFLKTFKEKGYYPKGYFTDNKNYFVLSKEAEALLNEDLQKKEERRKVKQQEEVLKTQYPGYGELETRITGSIEQIDDMAGINKKMDHDLVGIKTSMVQIRDYLKKNPDKIPSAKAFLDYFLPTTERLLTTYNELKDEVQTKNVVESRKNIESVMSGLNEAYKNMYNDFYTEQAMDIYSDVTVLQAMIKRENPENEFKG